MLQLDLFPATEEEFDSRIKKLSVEMGNIRRGAFSQITEIRKDFEFLQTQMEIIMDLLKEKEA